MTNKSFTTRSLNVKYPKADAHNALQYPIYESVAFEFDSAEQIAANFRGEYPAHVYSRTSNPTTEFFEKKIKELTGARNVLALSSGMAAISSTMLALMRQGENIITGNHLFGHTYALFNKTLPEYGITTKFVDLSNDKEIESAIDANTRILFFETVTNPQLEVLDIEALSSIAKKHHLILIADSTITPPIVFNSKLFGVDIELMSTTKFISGGATSVGGVAIDKGTFDWTKTPALADYIEQFEQDAFAVKLRKNIFRNTGPCMTAHTAYFQIMGLDILELRLQRVYENIIALGKFMTNHPKVITVNYPGLKSSKFYHVSEKQFNGIPGGVMTFDLESQEACFAFMNKLNVIRRATNLNDNKSLIIHPYSTIYTEFTKKQRAEMNILPTSMRLSVGIEGANDLIADIEQGLQH